MITLYPRILNVFFALGTLFIAFNCLNSFVNLGIYDLATSLV